MPEIGSVARPAEAQPASPPNVVAKIQQDRESVAEDRGRVDLRGTPGPQPVTSDGHAGAERLLDVVG